MFVFLIAAVATLGWVEGTLPPPDHCTQTPPYICYTVYAGPLVYDAALADCRGRGESCSLATPRNAEQNALITDVVGDGGFLSAIIGLRRLDANVNQWEISGPGIPAPPPPQVIIGEGVATPGWIDAQERWVNVFYPASFSDLECVEITAGTGNVAFDGKWSGFQCINSRPYVCQCPYDEVCGDPHFLLHMQGSSLPVCFDYQGHNNDIVQMIHDPNNGLTVNARLVTVGNKDHTYFQSLSVLTRDCTIYVNMYGITVQSNEIPWEELDTQTCGSISYMINKQKHVIITTETGVELMFSKKTNIPHLDFFIGDGKGLSSNAHGVLGQLENLEVHVVGYADGEVNEVGVMSFPNSPNRKEVKVMKKFRTSHHVACWHVGQGGGGLLIGEEKDYLVPNLEFNQLADGLRRPKGVNIL